MITETSEELWLSFNDRVAKRKHQLRKEVEDIKWWAMSNDDYEKIQKLERYEEYVKAMSVCWQQGDHYLVAELRCKELL